MKNYLLVAGAACALAGCASVFEGTSQDIAINTNPSAASCVLEREGRAIGAVPTTPGAVTVRKSKYDITIKCDKPGYQQSTYINHSGTTATIAANVAVDLLLTLGVSSIVDSATGADNKYDRVVNIMLAPIANGPATAQSGGAVTPAAATVSMPTEAAAAPTGLPTK
jgi:hypothetical protein